MMAPTTEKVSTVARVMTAAPGSALLPYGSAGTVDLTVQDNEIPPPKSATENAAEVPPATTKVTVSHANHLQRLLGNLPVGKRRNVNTKRPTITGRIQEMIQANVSLPGNGLSCTD